MPKRNRFPPEPETQPNLPGTRTPASRASGPAPKGKRNTDVPTLPPPKSKKSDKSDKSDDKASEPRTSGMQPRKPRESSAPRARIDEVTADMSKDPRREKE